MHKESLGPKKQQESVKTLSLPGQTLNIHSDV
jgi:hypothetical protein